MPSSRRAIAVTLEYFLVTIGRCSRGWVECFPMVYVGTDIWWCVQKTPSKIILTPFATVFAKEKQQKHIGTHTFCQIKTDFLIVTMNPSHTQRNFGYIFIFDGWIYLHSVP